ncbi:MAG TPA: methyl-accepting chemotaxis protein, partial [Thermodesulfobacteriota bacterium]|nr:methyl-accepting chemotaxis protein [Thermodesulfobacteriota bacterium]
KGSLEVNAFKASKDYGSFNANSILKELGEHLTIKKGETASWMEGGLLFLVTKIDLTPNDAIQSGFLVVGLNTVRILNNLRNTALVMAGLGLLIVILGAVVALFIVMGSITGPISLTVTGLSEIAEQVSSESTQVSTASQSLAEGASEQAAAIEETSASIEEMASMSRQNADNANQANRLMGSIHDLIEGANRSMNDLTESMVKISKDSEETGKIVKTIDEIAFQTNLLALNAAVEAARAGEAGAGFAVVADEVRNLALRAAEAARNTSGLIEGTVKNITQGSAIVEQTNGEFAKVSAEAKKVEELVGEIAAASHEQAQGVEQINRAVAEMDKVVQRNAANAEESASASMEMNSQADLMKQFVGKLAAMVLNRNAKRNIFSKVLPKRDRQGGKLSKIDSQTKGRIGIHKALT